MRNLFAFLIVVVVVSFAACQHPMAPTPSPISYTITDQGVLTSGPACTSATKPPVTEDVCTSTETIDHLQCVKCAVTADCIFVKAQVLCVKSCDDPACRAGHAYGK